MAYALVANTAKASPNAEDITTDPITTTGADLLVAVLSSYWSEPAPSVLQDLFTNTWVPLTTYEAASAVRLRTFYVQNATVGVNHTFTTVGGPTNLPAICVAAFSGGTLTGAFDQENGAASIAANTTFQAGSGVTPLEPNELIIAGCFFNPNFNCTGITGGGGFTILGNVHIASNAFGCAMAYQIQTAATFTNPTWTFDGGAYCAANLATFKAAAGAPAVDPSSLMLLGVG